MAEHDEDIALDAEPSDIEAETRRLMEEAMKGSSGGVTESPETTVESDSSSQVDELKEEDQSVQASGTSIIDDTFKRIQVRVEDLLSSIEDSLRATESGVDKQITSVVEALSAKLKTAGLGVFVNTAIMIVKSEISTGLKPEMLHKPVFDTIQESRDTVEDIVEKASRGALRTVGQSTTTLQARIVQMYSKISDLEYALEESRADVRRWRGKAKELEARLRIKDESELKAEQDMLRMKENQDDLFRQIEERGQEISRLKGELTQAQSQIEQQQELIDSLDKAEELVTDYEAKLVEVSELQGRLSELEDVLAQRESSLEKVRQAVDELETEKASLEWKVISMSDELSAKRGVEESHQAELDALYEQVEELKARWDMLYQVAEDEPAFKAYFLVAGKTHWFPLQHLSQAMGVPTVLLKRNLQKFIDIGLVEIEDDKIRPRELREVAKSAASSDKEIVEAAKAGLSSEDSDGEDTDSRDPDVESELDRPEEQSEDTK